MSGLTRTGKEILDLHDSGMGAELIAVVMRVSLGDVRSIIRLYSGTADDSDVLDELLPDTALTSAPQIGGWL